nr:hypothetical protein [Tanacetum cinerariifolium]
NSVLSDVVVESSVPSSSILNAFTEEIIAYEKETYEIHAVKIDDFVVAYMKYTALADTLDLRNSYKLKRNSNLHVIGSKARAVFNLDTRTRKFVLKVFDTIHNHELEHEEYKHLSKTERQLTYMEQAFIVKAASVNIGATRAYHLLTVIKGSYFLVHGTIVDFKNFFRSVNCYIGDSDADEVSKYNYREFSDVVSFDATFNTNKYRMVFVPFTVIYNHNKCVTVVVGLLKSETTKFYICLLKSFMKAFGKAHSIVVTDQDGAMKNAIKAEFGFEVCIIKESPYVYEMSNNNKKKKPQSVDKGNNKAEENDKVDMFFKKDGLYKALDEEPYTCRFEEQKNRYGEKNVVVENYINESTSIVDHCVHLLSKDEPRLGTFVKKLKSLKKEVEADCPNPHLKNKTDNLKQLVRVPKPPVVDFNNPTVGSTKRRKKLHIKRGKKKAVEKSLKGRNSCSLCGGSDHNKRTCPRRFEAQDEVAIQKEVCQKEVVVKKKECQEEVVQEKVNLAEDEEELSKEDEDFIHE